LGDLAKAGAKAVAKKELKLVVNIYKIIQVEWQ
jgi:hypothetical protein